MKDIQVMLLTQLITQFIGVNLFSMMIIFENLKNPAVPKLKKVFVIAIIIQISAG